MSLKSVDANDHGSLIDLEVGEPCIIRLPEIGGTGFLWHIEAGPMVETLDDRRQFDELIPGGGATREFVVTLRSIGQDSVVLRRYRPWEGAEQADATLTLWFRSLGPG